MNAEITIYNPVSEGVEQLEQFDFDLETYYTSTQLKNFFRVGTVQPGTFIKKMKDAGTPIPEIRQPAKNAHGFRVLWKASDVIKAAQDCGEIINESANSQADRIWLQREALKKAYQLQYEKMLAKLSGAEFLQNLMLESELSHKPIPIERAGFFDERIIVSHAKELIDVIGVYFLCTDTKVVYVGQSVNVPARVKAHENDPSKKFSSWTYLRTAKQNLNYIETLYIYILRPIYNHDKNGRLCTPIMWETLMEKLQDGR